MVKGEHARPLIGFVAVCATAALILGTGVTDPSTLRRIVAEQRVLPGSSLSELVLGRTFHQATKPSAEPATKSSPRPAAQPPSAVVLVSFTQATAMPAGPHSSGKHQHHAHHTGKPATHTVATAAPVQAAAPVAQPVTQPAAQPVAQPVAQPAGKPTGQPDQGNPHHAVRSPDAGDDADSSGDDSSKHSCGSRHQHSRGDGGRGQRGHQGRHSSPPPAPPAPAASTGPSSADHGELGGNGGSDGRDHGHDHGRGDGSRGDRSHGHRH